jgi:hypothetical protein
MRLTVTAYEGDGSSVVVPSLHALASIAVLGAVTWFAWSRRVRVRLAEQWEPNGGGER